MYDDRLYVEDAIVSDGADGRLNRCAIGMIGNPCSRAGCQRNRANALSSAVQTPQSIGMPTAVQTRAAVVLIAPRLIPNDPVGIEETLDNLACNAATSLSVINLNCFSKSGFHIFVFIYVFSSSVFIQF